MEPCNIPAATINELNMAPIRANSSSDAEEISRIGKLIACGDENTKDLIRLCELLRKHGYNNKSEELLRLNIVEEGDELHRAYIHMHGKNAEVALKRAIDDFSRQFGLRLELIETNGYLKLTYGSQLIAQPPNIDDRIMRFINTPCTIIFSYHELGSMADVTSQSPFLFDDYLLLKHTEKGWVIA